MITYLKVLLFVVAFFAYSLVPRPVTCKKQEDVQPNCPPGRDGQVIQGPTGKPGQDCNIVLFPNNQRGCVYADGTQSVIDPNLEKVLSQTNPKRFFLMSIVIVFGYVLAVKIYNMLNR